MTAFQKILIANRGEIARRIQRTCRAMGIRTVAIFADPDREAPFVREADEAVHLGPPSTGTSFLAFAPILEAARRTGAEAIHPGYGFLAENADFAAACAEAGLVFIGPSPETIRAMGSKVEAKEIARAAGVPIVPGFAVAGLSEAEVLRHARELGGPWLIKASAGGGGKGMRIVEDPMRLADALAAGRREAAAAFGDDTLLIERYLAEPRHVEIQILGDAHGHLVHLHERDCSLQRRHQKVVEEAPAPHLGEELRARMAAAALRLARQLDYRSAGTVEFVLDRDGNFHFLEVNTRLQVEHPVTEAITGLDLVRLQIEIAEGLPLPFTQEDVSTHGHAIEVRLYAEDPSRDFLPSTGRIVHWSCPPAEGIRCDSGVETGSEVTIHYDPMLAKLIGFGRTREEARRRLLQALASLEIHGLRHNRSFLADVLRHPDFVAGKVDTHFLARHFSSEQAPAVDDADRQNAVAAALWLQERCRAAAPVLANLPSGWRLCPEDHQAISFTRGEARIEVTYRVHSARRIDVTVDGTPHTASLEAMDGASLSLLIDSVRRPFRVRADGDRVYVQGQGGSSEFLVLPRFPERQQERLAGGCTAPMPGRVLAVRVAAGEVVQRGQVLLLLEAMKMEHEVTAPHDGPVTEVRVTVGDQVEAGAVLVVLPEPAAPSPTENMA